MTSTQGEGRPRLLIIEDEPNLAKLLAWGFTSFDVKLAHSGAEAMALLEQAPSPFDVLLCDLLLKDVTGAAIHAFVAARWPGRERRMVFMSGGVSSPTLQAFLEGVGNPYVEKPFDPDVLEALLVEVAEGGVAGEERGAHPGHEAPPSGEHGIPSPGA